MLANRFPGQAAERLHRTTVCRSAASAAKAARTFFRTVRSQLYILKIL